MVKNKSKKNLKKKKKQTQKRKHNQKNRKSKLNSDIAKWFYEKNQNDQCLKDKQEAWKVVLRQKIIALQARALLQAREKAFYEAERARNAALKKHMDALKEQERTIMNAEQMR